MPLSWERHAPTVGPLIAEIQVRNKQGFWPGEGGIFNYAPQGGVVMYQTDEVGV